MTEKGGLFLYRGEGKPCSAMASKEDLRKELREEESSRNERDRLKRRHDGGNFPNSLNKGITLWNREIFEKRVLLRKVGPPR